MKKLIPIFLLLAACHPVRNLEVIPTEIHRQGDTIHEQMLVTLKPMGVAHSRYALAVIRNDSCIAHLDCRGRPLKFPIRVWTCETKLRREVR